VVQELGALSADAGGTLDPGDGGLPADAWAGTPRPLAEGLIAALPDRLSSAALRRAAQRLLLSRTDVPAGPAGPRGLAALRLEKLADLGLVADVTGFAAAVAPALEDEAAASAWFGAQLLAGDADAACARADAWLRQYPRPVWQKYGIICSVRAGEPAGITLAVDLLREQGDADETFLLLAENAAAARKAPVRGVAALTLPQLALALASGRALPAEVTADSPVGLAAIALSAEVPAETRLPAAERAAALGTLAPRALAEVYARAGGATPPDDPLSAAAARKGPAARAILVNALRQEDIPGVKAELLRAAVSAAQGPDRIALLAGAYGDLLLQELAQVPAAGSFADMAGPAITLALLQGRTDLARPWVEVARGRLAGGTGESTPFRRLWPLLGLHGLSRPGDATAEEWLAAMGVTADADPAATGQALALAGGALALLQAAGQDVPATLWARTLGGSAGPAGLPDPVVWTRLARAGTEGSMAETLALAVILLGPEGPAGAHPLVSAHAVSGLTRAGLTAEARQVATEAMVALLDRGE